MGMISATLRAAYLHAINRPKEAPMRFWLAAKAIWNYVFNPTVSLHSHERLAACRQCALFDKKWKTCGIGTAKLSNGEYVGCLCYMPFKVNIPTATCWLHDQGVTSEGWKPEPKHEQQNSETTEASRSRDEIRLPGRETPMASDSTKQTRCCSSGDAG